MSGFHRGGGGGFGGRIGGGHQSTFDTTSAPRTPPQDNYGGGGHYNSSPSGFAGGGGGFNPSEHQDSPSSPSGKGGGSNVPTFTPVTVRQLYNARQAHPDDSFTVDGKQLNQITVVGQIVSVSVQSTKVELQLDDSTGKIYVCMWLNLEENNEYAAEQRAQWREGVYVRVIGHLRSFLQARSITAFRIHPIQDFNEITFHLLDTIYVHLYNTRGPLDAQPGAVVSHGHSSSSSSGGGGWGGPFQHSTGGGGGYAPQQQRGGGHVGTEVGQAVLEVIRGERDAKGISVQNITAALASMATDTQIRDTIEALKNEALIYSPMPDRFRASDLGGL
ncbi:DNA-directed RNA polymerase I subunit rpa2 [Balamuthia mandrillaris]